MKHYSSEKKTVVRKSENKLVGGSEGQSIKNETCSEVDNLRTVQLGKIT